MSFYGEASDAAQSGSAADQNSAPPKPELDAALQTARLALEELARALGADPKQAFTALEQAGRGASTDGVEKISDSVRRHPLAWVAGALGVGLILGLWRKS